MSAKNPNTSLRGQTKSQPMMPFGPLAEAILNHPVAREMGDVQVAAAYGVTQDLVHRLRSASEG